MEIGSEEPHETVYRQFEDALTSTPEAGAWVSYLFKDLKRYPAGGTMYYREKRGGELIGLATDITPTQNPDPYIEEGRQLVRQLITRANEIAPLCGLAPGATIVRAAHVIYISNVLLTLEADEARKHPKQV